MVRGLKCLLLAVVMLLVAACGGGGGGDETPTGDVTVSLSYSPQAGTVGTFYKYSPSYSSSQGLSEHFEISGGSLPPGLGISAGDGVISGTPTAAGTYSFSVTLTAKSVSGSVVRSGSIRINAASGSGSSSSAFSSSSSSVGAGLSTTVSTVTLGGTSGRTSGDSSAVGLSLNQIGSYTWTVASKPAWLTLSKSTGTVGTSSDSVTLSANQSLLAVGTQSGTLTLQAIVGASTVTKSVAVTANLDKHKLIASEVGVAFAKTPSWTRLTRTLTVRDNYGSGSWTAVSNQGWLTVTASGNSGGSLVLTANTTGLTLDQVYTATVTISSSNGASTETINVGLWYGSATPTKTTVSATYTKLVADPVRPLVYVHNGGSVITIYNVYTATNIGTITTGASVGSMEMSQDGTRLYALTNSGVLEIDPVAKTVLNTWPAVGSWYSGQQLRYVRPNGEGLLIVAGASYFDTGRIYRAKDGSSVTGTLSFISAVMAVSPDQKTLTSTTSGLSPITVYTYAIDYSDVTSKLSVTEGPSLRNVGRELVAVSQDSSTVIVGVDRFSLPGLTSLTAFSFPGGSNYTSDLKVGSDGRVFALGGSGPTDFWVFRTDTSLQTSDTLPDVLRLTPSGDALVAVVVTYTPSLLFVPVGP
jgi:hypothetical protein